MGKYPYLNSILYCNRHNSLIASTMISSCTVLENCITYLSALKNATLVSSEPLIRIKFKK